MRLVIISLCLAGPASAKTFTLVDDATKETYVCNSVAPAPAPAKEAADDSDCAGKVAKLCRERGAMSTAACSDLATHRCKDRSAKYADCARSTTQACIDSASGSAGTCLDRSLRECK